MITRRKLLRNGVAAGVVGLTGIGSMSEASARPTDFVQRDGRHFTVGGEKWYFSGSNNFWIQDPWRNKQAVDAFFELADQLNLNIVRTWGWCSGNTQTGAHCLQPTKGEFNEEGFKHFDYVIKRAGDYGIRLVIPFTDNWSAYGGMGQYVEWSPTASSHDDFYTDSNTREMYKSFVEYVLTRTNTLTDTEYREDPTVAIWELANEPRAKQAGIDALTNWMKEMSAFIKGIDSNHLVGTGMEGFYDGAHGGSGWPYDGSQGTAFIDQHTIDTIDTCSFHLYPYHWNQSHEWGTQWIRQHIRDAHEKIGKPGYIGEFGVHTSGTGQSQERADVYDMWYSALDEEDADAAMFWELVQEKRGNHDGFSVHINDEPTISQIEAYTELVHQKSGGSTGGGNQVAPINGTMPTDPDGDGTYEDLNGNGEIDFDDSVVYFENMDSAAMTDHASAYDYNANNEIDYSDLVELMKEIE
jgi:mannan endo-1,4-beta-mannosidase